MAGKLRITAGPLGPAVGSKEPELIFPPGTDCKRRECVKRVNRKSFFSIKAKHQGLGRVKTTVYVTDAVPGGAAGNALYSEILEPFSSKRKSNGKIEISLPGCGNKRCKAVCPERDTLEQVFKHEYSHLATRRMWKSTNRSIPTWVEEGYPEFLSTPPEKEGEALYLVGVNPAKFTLDDLYKKNTPAGSVDSVFYKYYFLVFILLANTYGREKVVRFAKDLVKMNWRTSIQKNFGLSVERLYKYFMEYIEEEKSDTILNLVESVIDGAKIWWKKQ